MKKILIYSILILLFTGCITPYVVKNNKEYVLLNELNLTCKEQVVLHWKTFSDSPFAVYDHRSEKFFYDKNYDYSPILKNKK
jgi:hypothetical protein